jgi:hypothetical protein
LKERNGLITHIVCFKLKDRSEGNVQKTRDVLLSMQGRIPQLLHLEVGADVLHSDRSFDLALVSKFNSLADLDAYQIHPVHQEIIAYMKIVNDVLVAVDYES